MKNLEHFSYDGVYEQSLNRIRGGGGLGLIDHVADFLGVGPGIITGNWDLGHKIQLVLSDVFKKGDSSQIYSKYIDIMYELMKMYRDNKQGLIFTEVAEEMRHTTVKLRGRQETRWAKVDLVNMVGFCRDAATIYVCLGRDIEKARMENDMTTMKNLLKKREILRDPMFWLHLLAFIQIFNIIVEASLESQHESYFSTSALYLVSKAMDKIQTLGEDWVWENECLVFAGIGSPSQHVENLTQNNGFFKPVVGDKAKMRSARMINKMQNYRRQLHGVPEEDFDDELTYQDIIVGEIPIEGFKPYMEIKVSRKMEDVCGEIYKSFNERLRASALLKKAVEAFHGETDWLNDDEDTEVQIEICSSRGKKGSDAGVNSAPNLISPGVSQQREDDREAKLEKLLEKRKY